MFRRSNLQLESFAFRRIFNAPRNNVKEIFGQYERDSFPIDAKFLLKVAQKVAEIDVKDAAVFADHDIVRISVADTKDERRDAITGARMHKSFDCLFISVEEQVN